jgi:hypothetical protein
MMYDLQTCHGRLNAAAQAFVSCNNRALTFANPLIAGWTQYPPHTQFPPFLHFLLNTSILFFGIRRKRKWQLCMVLFLDHAVVKWRVCALWRSRVMAGEPEQ